MEDAANDPRTRRWGSGFQIALLTLLRIAIGWHFLYEGLVKVFDPGWTSEGYLASSQWFLGGMFQWIAGNADVLAVVDFLNQWGLVVVGVGLLLGVFTRAAACGGALLLALYYVAQPPFLQEASLQGHYLFIDNRIIEIVALLIVAFLPAGRLTGLDALWARLRAKEAGALVAAPAELPCEPVPQARITGRREMLASLASLPFLGAFAYSFVRRKSLEEKYLSDAVTSATLRSFSFSSPEDLKGTVPHSKIQDLELSRVILGGNLIGGWAHARDLIYVSKLVKAYHHERKIFETLYLAEQCGINTILTNPILSQVINKYWDKGIGKIQFISDCALKGKFFDGVKMSIDNGAHACYVQGGIADRFVADGKIDDIAKALEIIREAKLPAGIGAHELKTVQACVDAGLRPDFWMKTLHTTDYWSAKPEEKHNNIWCTEPDETVAYMESREEPWIAFKVLAAGALHPKTAFRYAFESGADFICVGMYDFQIVDDVNLALDVLGGEIPRNRPWRTV